MSAHLSREETEALLETPEARADARAQEVSPRDFGRPQRLSRRDRRLLARAVDARLPALERALADWLREGASLELDEVGEVSALGLFEGLQEPFVVQTLEVRGHQGWVVVQNPQAQALAESALGTGAEEPERTARRLSPIEAGLVGDILTAIARGIAPALELELEAGALLQETRTLELSLDADLAREARRVAFYIHLSGSGLPETIVKVYLPDLRPPALRRDGGPKARRPLPAYLSAVPVELSAQLGTIEVPLSDLLSLEVGDVVPLGVGGDAPAIVHVGGEACGRASWGSHGGELALRILDFEPPDEEQ